MAARRAHNPKVAGSNPAPATKYYSLGGKSVVVPPVSFPNTVVKRHSADDTALARVWENRSLPGGIFILKIPIKFPRDLYITIYCLDISRLNMVK